jgi:Ca-activated chloride channel family protein
MSQPFPSVPDDRARDWRLRVVLPSWLTSLVLHAAAVLLYALLLSRWQHVPAGIADEPGREVGIYVKQPGEASEAAQASEQETAETANEAHVAAAESVTSETPPVPIALPQPQALEHIGLGTPQLPFVTNDAREMVQANGARPQAGLPGMIGSVQMFGASDKGTRIVYVVDSSGSMMDYGAIRASKAELLASLQTLTAEQQFQIVFYSDQPKIFRLRGEPRPQLHFATEIHRTLAQQFIAGIQADAGTNHMPALKEALRLGPEVVFFLTDAKEPILTGADLSEIQRLNPGRTHIHCIEFGKGPELNGDNFLKRLARQNGGTYHYRDVTQFRLN